MSLAYAAGGLIGVLTPQANTTVEPEAARLLPEGFAAITARLVSTRPTVMERLVEYVDAIPATARQFADAPVGAIAFACTGSSYLVGASREDRLIAERHRQTGIPLVTAGIAVTNALRTLGARRIGLVSPYDDALTEASIGYWRARGFEVGTVTRAADAAATGAHHPIYGLPAEAATAALAAHPGAGHDALVMLGTGLATLPAIAAHPRVGGAPVISCMLALIWNAVAAAGGAPLARDDLEAWISGRHWRARLDGGARRA